MTKRKGRTPEAAEDADPDLAHHVDTLLSAAHGSAEALRDLVAK